MRKYLLDTSVLTAYLLDRKTAIKLIKPWIRQQEVVTSIIVYGEVHEYMLGKSDYPDLKSKLGETIHEIKPLSVTHKVMERYGIIRRMLRPKRNLIGDIDTIIASTALERNLTLVTADEDFKRVPNLKLMLIPRSKLKRPKQKRH